MSIAIRLTQTGGPNVLRVEPITEARPAQGEVWIEQEAIGVNYLDVTQRNGSVPIALPSGLGLEAAGRVAAIGPDVANVAVGDRVAYILGPIGSYASGRLYPVERLVRLPDVLSADDAAECRKECRKGVSHDILSFCKGRPTLRISRASEAEVSESRHGFKFSGFVFTRTSHGPRLVFRYYDLC